ncbi:MAG: acylneuraminate cytidylyltransferase family protein [Alphaproteobacteria bacterium]|nr:acylneuraminate cytidylyltransferase family protein [Alphaproteobacteria bacterium]
MTRVLGLVCCRGGSKGVPGKNIKSLAGKPLLGWTLEQAKTSGVFTDMAISSDDAAILATAKDYGANIIINRPAALATDEIGSLPVITHALAEAEAAAGKPYDYLVLLQVTSPFRLPSDITAALEMAKNTGASSVISATPAKDSPYYTVLEQKADGSYGIVKPLPDGVVRRQDAPACYALNGSIYVWKTVAYKNDPKALYPDSRLYLMPEERSLDIDTPWDFTVADLLMKHLSERA